MKSSPDLNRRALLRVLLQGVAFGLVGTVAIFYLTTNAETLAHLRQFPWASLPLLFAMVFTAWCCNGARMALMCRAAGFPLRFRQAIAISLSTEFGIAATPAGLGGTMIRLSLLRKAGVPLSTGGSMIVTDAAIDGIFFAILTPFVAFELVRGGVLRGLLDQFQGSPAAIGFIVAGILLVGLACLGRWQVVHDAVDRAAGATEWGRARRLAGKYRKVRIDLCRGKRRGFTALAFLWRERRGTLVLNLLIAATQWSCRYLMLFVIIRSLHYSVSPLPLFFLQGGLFAFSLLFVLPGGGGGVELLSGVLLPHFIPTGAVGIVVLVWRFFTYHLYILGGGLMFFYTWRQRESLFPSFDRDRRATGPEIWAAQPLLTPPPPANIPPRVVES